MEPLHDQSAFLTQLLNSVLQNAGLELSFTQTPGQPHLVLFTGPDVPHLLSRNAELLLALEHLATQALRLEPDQHDQISFDAGDFKATRQRALERSARTALLEVRRTRQAYHFHPMNSRERRLLHLTLTGSGLRTASEGEGPQRHLVLHPPRS